MSISIASATAEAAEVLRVARIGEPQREAGLLLSHALGRDRCYVLTHPDDPIPKSALESFRTCVTRRAAGKPLQYITGHQEFFKLDFEVTPDVLIPRPETELIVEVALELLTEVSEPFIADIGTGSGCIAISLLHDLPQARAVAGDISSAALSVAQRNAARYDVIDRITLIESDCFSAVPADQPFSLVVSNPPYVADRELETLPREVREHEPRVALAGGTDGLSVIRRLLVEVPRFLAANGHLVFEIGFRQSEAVKKLVDPQVWELLEVRNDLQGIPRTMVLKKRNGNAS